MALSDADRARSDKLLAMPDHHVRGYEEGRSVIITELEPEPQYTPRADAALAEVLGQLHDLVEEMLFDSGVRPEVRFTDLRITRRPDTTKIFDLKLRYEVEILAGEGVWRIGGFLNCPAVIWGQTAETVEFDPAIRAEGWVRDIAYSRPDDESAVWSRRLLSCYHSADYAWLCERLRGMIIEMRGADLRKALEVMRTLTHFAANNS